MNKFLLWVGMLVCSAQATAQPIQKMKLAELQQFISGHSRPLVLSFWATWCGSCTEEIPYFISTVREKYRDSVDLVLVSLDPKSFFPDRISRLAKERQFNVPIIWLNESNADIFCPGIDKTWSGAIPSTLMVNQKTGYHQFYEQGLSPLQFDRALRLLIHS